MFLRSALRSTSILSASSSSTTAASLQKRFFNIHEYQGQDLMRKYGIPVPDGGVATSPEEAEEVAKSLDTEDLVIKAQVLAGGRGKGHFDNGFKGGVHLVRSSDEIRSYASKMLGAKLITKQNKDGLPCEKVLVARREYIRSEMYVAILLDRNSSAPMFVVSPEGGMNIEEVAEENPDAIFKLKVPVECLNGAPLPEAEINELAEKLGFIVPSRRAECVDILQKLFRLFTETDCTMCEINPMIENADGRVMCADAKFAFDPNAAFRQSELHNTAIDVSQMDEREVEAAKYDLNYIGLDGNIGCLVNGAGLAMATMDVIKLAGGSPANFLDIGGGATEKQVTEALRIIASDPGVEGILINIFGGIMRCDVIALGLINAYTLLDLKIPLVVRLRGTNVEKGKELLEGSGLRIIPADDLDEAAQKAVKVANIMRMARESDLHVSFELPI